MKQLLIIYIFLCFIFSCSKNSYYKNTKLEKTSSNKKKFSLRSTKFSKLELINNCIFFEKDGFIKIYSIEGKFITSIKSSMDILYINNLLYTMDNEKINVYNITGSRLTIPLINLTYVKKEILSKGNDKADINYEINYNIETKKTIIL